MTPILVANTVLDVNGLDETAGAMSQFLHSLYDSFPTLADLLVRAPLSTFSAACPFIPSEIKLRDFLSASALPAIFGHCWSWELRHAYIEFLVSIAERLPASIYDRFSNHWLFSCIKSFIHTSGIQTFLQLSLGDPILNIVRNPPSTTAHLVGWVQEMVIRMNANIEVVPSGVRILLKKLSKLAGDDQAQLDRLESIFVDCVLAPAISFPKQYGTLPSTYYFDLAVEEPGRTLRSLAQIFTFVLHPQTALRRHPDFDVNHLAKIQLGQFLKKLVDFEIESKYLGGPSLARVLLLLGRTTAPNLFSVPDVCLLAKILASVGFRGADAVPTDAPFGLDFFRFEVKNFDLIGLRQARRVSTIAPRPSPIIGASRALYQVLESERASGPVPESLTEFLRFHESAARSRCDLRKCQRVAHLGLALRQLPGEEFSTILDMLDNEIRRQRDVLGTQHAMLTGISRAILELDDQIAFCRQRSERAFDLVYGSLLGMFLDGDPALEPALLKQKANMLVEKQAFVDFFAANLDKLKAALGGIAPHMFSHVAANLHSWMMQKMTLDDFIALHEEFVSRDELLSGVTKDVIHRICIVPAPKQLKTILMHPPLFQFCEIELLDSEFLQLPIEAMAKIGAAIVLINKLFELAHGCPPQADEMTPLLNFALLSSGISKMFSLQSYLKHFLFELPQGDAHLLGDQASVSLAHFIHHVSSLANLVGATV
jgi:hypothetical protein